ncbi:MAG: hypothetical protein HRK26_00800 [Rickettsiaceae bacterium H1]|nr:hypothetical protein [Rickettsiaceae bacterium H1]
MIDYLILACLFLLIIYCSVLSVKLKSLKLSYMEITYLVKKLKSKLVVAKSESNMIINSLDESVQKCISTKEKTELTIADLKFMSERADKIIGELYNIIQVNRKSDNVSSFKELLLKIAK